MSRLVLLRSLAMAAPLLIVAIAKTLLDPATATHYFQVLTDTVLMVTIAKLGVDTYLPGCQLNGSCVLVERRQAWAFLGSAAIVFGLTLAAWPIGDGSAFLQFPGTLLAMSALLAAEICRLRAHYLSFYLLKAPALYLSLFIAVLLPFDWSAYALLLLGAFIALITVGRAVELRPTTSDFGQIAAATLVSMAIVLFSWKEAFAQRLIEVDFMLVLIVFYTRIRALINFPFITANARLPNLLRQLEETGRPAPLLDLADKHRWAYAAWALATMLAAALYCLIIEPWFLTAALLLMVPALIQTCLGNTLPILIFYRCYRALLTSYLTAGGLFTAIYMLSATTIGSAQALGVAAILAQLALGIAQRQAVARLQTRPVAAPSPA